MKSAGTDRRSNFIILDLPAALAAIGGNEEVLKKMAYIFYEDMPRVLEKLRKVLEDEDAALIMREAHTISGASSSLKANKLAEVAVRVEQAASRGRYSDASRLFERLGVELEKVRTALEITGILDR